jgi:hypothetical protein
MTFRSGFNLLNRVPSIPKAQPAYQGRKKRSRSSSVAASNRGSGFRGSRSRRPKNNDPYWQGNREDGTHGFIHPYGGRKTLGFLPHGRRGNCIPNYECSYFSRARVEPATAVRWPATWWPFLPRACGARTRSPAWHAPFPLTLDRSDPFDFSLQPLAKWARWRKDQMRLPAVGPAFPGTLGLRANESRISSSRSPLRRPPILR